MPAFYPLHERDGKRPRVTVGVVSADLRSDHTAKCIDLVKAHSRDYDLVIVDNNRCGEFNHSREMNRLLEFCRTEFLVLMDDDVFVQEGWFPEKAPIRIEMSGAAENGANVGALGRSRVCGTPPPVAAVLTTHWRGRGKYSIRVSTFLLLALAAFQNTIQILGARFGFYSCGRRERRGVDRLGALADRG